MNNVKIERQSKMDTRAAIQKAKLRFKDKTELNR